MSSHSPEEYLHSLIAELERAYDEYHQVLASFRKSRGSWKSRLIHHFLTVEHDAMHRIGNREKVLARWLEDCPAGLAARAEQQMARLASLRQRTARENRSLMEQIRSDMNKLKEEQKSLRIPRSKPIKKESVPGLIDITL